MVPRLLVAGLFAALMGCGGDGEVRDTPAGGQGGGGGADVGQGGSGGLNRPPPGMPTVTQVSTFDSKIFRLNATLVELADGPIARLSVNFYVCTTRQRGLEFHGDEGSIHLGCFQAFNASVAKARPGEAFEDVALIREGASGVEWGRGVRDMAEAIREGRSHRATGDHALHVLEVLAAATESSQSGARVKVDSDIPRPTPMEWSND